MINPKLLVVDDEEAVGQVFQRALGKKNFEVHVIQDAKQALEEIEKNFFNLLIVDFKLPGMNGVELLKKIKEINPYIEVIIITGYGTTQSAVNAIKLGAFDYIDKPFDIVEIERKIKACLERQKRAIENIELKELVAFFEVSKTITSLISLDDLLKKILDSAIYVTKSERGILLLIDDVKKELIIKSSREFNGLNTGMKFPLNNVISDWLGEHAKPLLIDNQKSDDWFCKENELCRHLSSFISPPLASTPLVFQDKILGIVVVSAKISREGFTLRDLTLLNVLASQAAISFENAKLYSRLQNKIDELEQTIKTLNQTKAQLIQAEKLASVGRLAAGVVHEICNPLNVISGRAQLMLMDIEEDSPFRSSLRIIEDYVSRTSRIANNLLKFAKPNRLQVSELDVNGLLADVLNLLENRLVLKNVKVINEFSPSLPRICGDAGQLQQVFLNMILNAEQAMPDGGDLVIRTSPASDNSFIEASFRDTGYGISEEDIDKIFDPFFTSKEGGTGLGLSVSYGIIKKHKGDISVESKQGQGSIFIVKLPAIEVSQQARNEISCAPGVKKGG
ncbi:MAG: response regulator [Candidatus Omnitrophota bacterium]